MNILEKSKDYSPVGETFSVDVGQIISITPQPPGVYLAHVTGVFLSSVQLFFSLAGCFVAFRLAGCRGSPCLLDLNWQSRVTAAAGASNSCCFQVTEDTTPSI